MIKTELCDLLGIKYPIIQAGMGPFVTIKLCQAVSTAGALGIISHTALIPGTDPVEKMREDIRWVNEHTRGNFGVNVRVAKIQTDAPGCIDCIIEEMENSPEVARKLKLVTTSAGNPEMPSGKFISSGVKEKYGLKHFHVVASAYMAGKAESAGCDGVIAMGHEAGGHIAYSDVNTIILLPEIVDTTRLPVVATGGFCDGRGLAAALLLGAVGVQMGTRFIATKESEFHPEYKRRILASKDTDSVATAGAFGPIRLIRNAYSEKDEIRVAKAIVQGTEKGLSVEQSRRTMADPANLDPESLKAYVDSEMKGEMELAPVFAGEVVGRIDDIPSVKELLERIMAEAEDAIKSLPRKVIVRRH